MDYEPEDWRIESPREIRNNLDRDEDDAIVYKCTTVKEA
jgi:hypothetical protein